MTQTEAVPSSDSIDYTEPKNWLRFANMDLGSLESLMAIAERNLDGKILDRIKKSKEFKALDDQFRVASSKPETTPEMKEALRIKCRNAAEEQYALSNEIDRRHRALLPIREAIIAKQNPT